MKSGFAVVARIETINVYIYMQKVVGYFKSWERKMVILKYRHQKIGENREKN